MKKVALIFIGTYKYADFFPTWKENIDNFFLKDCEKTVFVFTDREEEKYFDSPDVVVNRIEHQPWPYITLLRFKMMQAVSEKLKRFDLVFFVDADLFVLKEINLQEILDDRPLVGVQHPGNFKYLSEVSDGQRVDGLQNPTLKEGDYVKEMRTSNLKSLLPTVEKEIIPTNWDPTCKTKGSTAYIEGKISDYGTNYYHQGCFWGGQSSEVMKMVKQLDENVDLDLSKGIIADWHDESHLNKYFLENISKVKTLSPSYAMPDFPKDDPESVKFYSSLDSLEIKSLHVQKGSEFFTRFKGGKSK